MELVSEIGFDSKCSSDMTQLKTHWKTRKKGQAVAMTNMSGFTYDTIISLPLQTFFDCSKLRAIISVSPLKDGRDNY